MLIHTSTSLKTLLAELVSIPTVTTEPAACRVAISWIRYQLDGLPLYFTESAVDTKPTLVVTTRPTKWPAIMLHTHLDVVPAPSSDFSLVERDGKYFGRGVFDMKYAAASYIKLFQELGTSLPQYDIGIAFTCDEETAGPLGGAPSLAEAGWGGGVMINPDAVGGWGIQRAAKGRIRMRVESSGEPGHASRPWQYRSAVSQLMDFLQDLSSQFPAEPCGDPEHAHHTLTVGIVKGGEAANQVAGEAFAELDLRVMPPTPASEIVDLVNATAARHSHINTHTFSAGEAISIDPESPQVKHIAGLIEKVSGTRPDFILAHGASESGYYMAKGIPVMMFGPHGGGHHSNNEWISVEGVGQFLEFLRRYVQATASE
jgi:succinyl-diaminopimelate desuccinylase